MSQYFSGYFMMSFLNVQLIIGKIKLVNGQARIYHHQKIIDIMKLYETYHHAIRNYHFVVTITGLVCMPYTPQHLTELLHPKGIISYPNYITLMKDSTIGSHELVNVYLHDSLFELNKEMLLKLASRVTIYWHCCCM